MVTRQWKVGIALAAVFVVTGILAVLAVAETRAADKTVDIQNLAFAPASLSIAAGDRVIWTNRDGVTHTVTSSAAGQFNSPVSAGSTFAHTFATAGTFPYMCTIHAGMAGSIVVTAAAATPAPASTGNAGLAADEGGSDRLMVLGVGAAAVVLAAGGALVVVRRRA